MQAILGYYGGKQRIASKIVPHINKIPHNIYVESFCGGAAVLFEKDRPRVVSSDYREVINDMNKQLITFYRVAKTKPAELHAMIQGTLHSRADYKRSMEIYKDSGNYNDLEIAWAVWVNLNQSFAYGFNKGWAFNLETTNLPYTIANKKARLSQQLKRLEQLYIECDDALKVIEHWDSPQTVFYCDPPYVNTSQGHYEGYSEDDYKELIGLLSTIEGSFVLSGYPNELVPEEWEYVTFGATMSAAHGKQRKDIDIKRQERLWIVDKTKNSTNRVSFSFNRQGSLFDAPSEASQYA